MAAGRHTSVLLKMRPYIFVTISAEVRGRETGVEKGFMKHGEEVSKTDSYIDKDGMLKVFAFKR